jgi:hypothetical protein
MEFKRLWQTDKDEFIENFLNDDPDADAFEQAIIEYKVIIKEIQSQVGNGKLNCQK